MQRTEELFERLSTFLGSKVETPGALLRLVSSKPWADSSVFIRSLIEVSIFWQEGRDSGAVFAAIPSKHLEQACQHAIAVLLRLEQGPTKRNLLEAVSRRWPIHVLKVAPELPTDEERARIIGWLLIHRTFRASLLRLAQGLKEPFWRVWALQGLMKDEPFETQVRFSRELVAAARQLGDAGLLEEAWRRFVGPLSAEELEQCFADVRARQAPLRRAMLCQVLLRPVAPEARGGLARELLSALRQLGPGERAEALGEGGRYLPEEFVSEALELLADAPAGESWFRAHERLAAYLSEEQLDRLLVEAAGLAPEVLLRVCPKLEDVSRSLGISLDEAVPEGLWLALLLVLISRNPERNRERLFHKALVVLGRLRSRSAQLAAFEQMGPLISALPEPLERMVAELMTEPATCWSLIPAVGSLLSSPVILSLLETWARTLDGEARAKVFGALARRVSGERRREVVFLLQRATAPVSVWGLAAFAPRLNEATSGELLRPVWEALRRSRDEEETRELLSLLIDSSPPGLIPEVVERAAEEWFARTSWFYELVVWMSRGSPALLGRAIALARATEDPWERLARRTSLLSRMPVLERSRFRHELWTEVLQEHDAKVRAVSLVRLTSQMDTTALHEVVDGVLDALAEPEVHEDLRGRLLHELVQGLDSPLPVASAERAIRMAEQLAPGTLYRDDVLAALRTGMGRPRPPSTWEVIKHSIRLPMPRIHSERSGEDRPVVRGPPSEDPQPPRAPIPTSSRLPNVSPQELGQLCRDVLERMSPSPEPVLLGIAAPFEVSTHDAFTARFVACVERLEREVTEKLERWSPGTITQLRFQRCQWQLGSRVRVRVTSPHLSVSPEEQEFLWNADACVLDFGVQVPSRARGRRTSLQFEVLFEGTRLALLRHDLTIVERKRAPGERRIRLGRAPRTAFASYATDDRDRVLDRVASLQLAAGLQVFMDCLSLRPGERWKESVREEILQRDLFLLFWSRQASNSKWVKWEWRTALRLKGRDCIQPHPLESFAVAPPPKELAMLHFADPHMLVRNGPER